MSVADADRQAVADAVARAGSSFTWGMRILPKPRREAMYAIYAFCRAVDDAADDASDEAAARSALEDWRTEIAALFAGAPKTAIGRALVEPVAVYGLRQADFDAVIDGCAMDAGAPIFAPDERLLDQYIDRVACAVGRLSVRAFGVPDALGPPLAAAQGRALQLTNILRDFEEDAERGRLYAPRELLVEAGAPIIPGDPWATLHSPDFRQVAGWLAERAAGYFRETEALLVKCPSAAARPARLMARVYEAQWNALAARGWSRPLQPARLSKGAKLWTAMRSLIGL
ncbi:MAG: presqualene diphosphate synthase HpnD [Pseudomonadota bacterium]